MLDYYEIGQRIRKYRKASGLSQEELAERVEISTTHMSHIETGNTKLSLPVFVDIAMALEIHTDELLFDTPKSLRSTNIEDILNVLNSCDTSQLRILSDIVRATKISLDKNM